MTWTPSADGSFVYEVADYAIHFLRPRLAGGGVHGGSYATVSVGLNGKLVHEADYKISSLTDRTKLAKYLASRGELPKDCDWNGVIENACTRMCRTMRAGKLAIDLSTLEDPGEPTYDLEKLLLHNQVTIGFGNGESGKSLLAVSIAYAVAGGSQLLGLRPERRPVYYLDWETDDQETRRRLQRLSWGQGRDDVPLVTYFSMDRPLADDSETMRQISDAVVIVDSLAPACGGDVMKGEGPQLFWTATRSLRGCSVLVIAQTQKDPKAQHTIYGSGMFHYMARSVWEIKGHQDGDVVHVAAFHVKANTGRKFGPLAWRYTFDDSARTLVVDEEKPIDVPEFAARLPLADQIAGILIGGATSVKDIAAECDLKEDAVRVTLNRRRDRFVKVDDKWGLLERNSVTGVT